MPRQREIMVGSRNRFAMKVAFLPDPDRGHAASKENSLSWGAVEFWANGHNVCHHVEQGETIDAAHWYLLPMLRWLSSNWDFLLHEERLPVRNAARDAWISMQRTAEPPPAVSEETAEQWEVSWHNWWQRHALLAAREGGLLPNLFIRRWRDQIELSWGDRPIAGAPDGFRFDAAHGCARFASSEVAEVLYGILDDASQHLLSEEPKSPVFKQLRQDVRHLRRADRRRRLGLLSGYRPDELQPEVAWQQIESFFPDDLPAKIENAVFGVQENELVIEHSDAALMFGSLSPSIDEDDARLLAQKLVQFRQPQGESIKLSHMVEDVPVERSDERAWKQGYQLAENCLEAIDGAIVMDRPIAIEEIYKYFNIKVDSISLNDASIRAVALAGPHHRPAVLINSRYSYRAVQPRRFTLAHELCHILYDRTYGARLAMASGPWAPLEVEQRANAFAAMLLMPTDLIASFVRMLPYRVDSAAAVWKVANAFETSFTATLEHLSNLGEIDESTRDALRAENEAKTIHSNHPD